jgi:uncharacterized membrane protein
MIFLTLKTIHIISAFLLFGTGLGSAFYKFLADRNGVLENIVITNKNVVLADWIFTTPTIIIQPITGIMMANMINLPLTTPWIMLSLTLYAIAGICWLPVVVLQIRMLKLSKQALENQTALPEQYYRYARLWFWLGIPAFLAITLVIVLMVFKSLLV